MATLQELLAEKERLEREIEQRRSSERESALAEIRAIMDAHDLTVTDIAGGSPRRAARGSGGGSSTKGSKVAAKYRHPETGETWSGRGLKPRWLKAALDQGRTLEEFAVA